ncbi:hypothetical protein [Xanthomonas vesicatoria]|uniref:hypothetical protein n=1 Tax=Xanthomonas vesicatoria TaxID=56460 RepID=UPI0013E03897|nr:hypothetical protein [Xanthomonas vesicatoria]
MTTAAACKAANHAGHPIPLAKFSFPPVMLRCSVICSLMIAIFICEQPGTCRLVDIEMQSLCRPDAAPACTSLAERGA